LLLARRVGSRGDLTGSEEIRSEGAVKRVDSSLGAFEHLGRLCRYRSQPAGDVGTKGSERVNDRVVLLIGVVVLTVTDLTAQAGSRVGAHADIDVAGIEPVLWQLKLTIILVDFNVTLSGQ
jgi:hypothetical protein